MSLSRRQVSQADGATAALPVTGRTAGASPALAAFPGPDPPSQGAQVLLADDNGANDNLWRFL
ncbi:hypothetical protein [Nonomuraea sp. NPDC050691]|uniref:hypothetical protein n=1 Tax=Nonomuraea sp. NPDC050691 TaxID=3155661 RepID=UPI0033D61799